MESKFSAATPKRLTGHLLDAPAVHIDLQAYISQLIREPSWLEGGRNAITVFKTEGMSIVLTVLHEGATLIENTVDSLLSIHVLEGRVKAEVDHHIYELQQHQVLALHDGIPHTVTATSEAKLLLTLAG
jgi:quercetin dioxygenase-like cupin family protein